MSFCFNFCSFIEFKSAISEVTSVKNNKFVSPSYILKAGMSLDTIGVLLETREREVNSDTV